MDLKSPQTKDLSVMNSAAKITIFIAITILMSNLNALVDSVLHPDIPYFDNEHLIVGGVTGFVSMFFFGLLALYMRYLNRAHQKIQTLEAILPICAYCKKIRKPNTDPTKDASWQTIESYITEKTTTEFSHSICPKCSSELSQDMEDMVLLKPDQDLQRK